MTAPRDPIEAPATEAGRSDHETAWDSDNRIAETAIANHQWLAAGCSGCAGIARIEQQARDEGRREGCSKHHSAEDCRAYFEQTLEQARDEGRREAVREIRRRAHIMERSITEDGLTARYVEADDLATILEAANQTPPGFRVGDASESGQPPEAE